MTTALEIMQLLDQGSNMFGPLKPSVRSRLFALIDEPNAETWGDARGIVVASIGHGGMTLWQALLEYTDFRTGVVPNLDQIFSAIEAATGKTGQEA